MTVEPNSVEDLQRIFSRACASGEKIGAIHLGSMNRLLEHAAEDMTATVETGMVISDLQSHLARHRQWLPIDPPQPALMTLGEVLATNASGPRRFGHGTIRDYVLGVRAVLASGDVIRAGGKVVKNVAGYDLARLFIGARDSLGVVVEATFKLKPLPEAERFVEAQFETLDRAGAFIDAVMASALDPVVLDIHNLAASSVGADCFTVVLGFAGAIEDVDYQLGLARELGAAHASSLAYFERFWSEKLNAPVRRRSVLPSELISALRQLGPVEFVARAGNGFIEFRGGSSHRSSLPEGVRRLSHRLKDTFDPKHILPELPL